MEDEQQTKRILPEIAWNLILAVQQFASRDEIPHDSFCLAADTAGNLRLVRRSEAETLLSVNRNASWQAHAPISPEAAQLFDLYLAPALASRAEPLTIAHLGQSLDGRIATETGDSYYVTGEANILHLHCMRALADAILVGAGTIQHDDPQLTTRRVPGDSPVRVIIDAKRRLSGDYKVFKDGSAPTLLLCRAGSGPAPAGVEVVEIAAGDEALPPAAIIEALHARGLYTLFVEGGGVTVSRFLEAGVLDRLQVAVAPMIIGSGRPSITLPELDSLSAALRPPCRKFDMGDDVLFDFDLRDEAG